MSSPLWLRVPPCLGGMGSIWVGALLASVNGYPLRLSLTSVASVGIFILIVLAAVYLGGSGAALLNSLLGGFVPCVVGYYLNSGHWAGELFFLAFLFSLSALTVWVSREILSYTEDTQNSRGNLVARAGLTGSALIYTGVNIMVIASLVFCLYFPAVPLPYRQVLWLVIGAAVINQELLKRKFYQLPRQQLILWRLSSISHLTLMGAFLLITWGRL